MKISVMNFSFACGVFVAKDSLAKMSYWEFGIPW